MCVCVCVCVCMCVYLIPDLFAIEYMYKCMHYKDTCSSSS